MSDQVICETPHKKTETTPLNHEQFLQQYILNRALGNTGGLDAGGAVHQAERAWQEIKRLTAKDPKKNN